MLIANKRRGSLCALAAAMLVSGCWWSTTRTSSTTEVRISNSLSGLLADRLQAPSSYVGVFIGVSNSPRSGTRDTPAHTIAAILFYEAFKRAASKKNRESNLLDQPDDYLSTDAGNMDSIGDSLFLMLANLRMTPNDDRAHPEIVQTLSEIYLPAIFRSEVNRNFPRRHGLFEPFNPNFEEVDDDGMHRYFGTPEATTKSKILSAIRVELELVEDKRKARDWLQRIRKEHDKARADEMMKEFVPAYFVQPTLVVFYIAAHGGITPNGRQYLVPEDADQGKPASLLYYDELLHPFIDFSVLSGARDFHLLVIVDACQQTQPGATPPRPLNLPEGITFVESASPGEWAWHWSNSEKVEETVSEYDEKTLLFGFIPVPTNSNKKKGKFDRSFISTMSVFPIAAHQALRGYGRELDSEGADRPEPVGVRQWMEDAGKIMPWLLQQDPNLKGNPNARQTLRVTKGEGGYDFAAFKITHKPKTQ